LISLNGTWKISLDPPDNFWKNDVNFSDWPDIQVPGEAQMQGFAIKHDQPFVYRSRFRVPDDFQGKQIFLNFHGIYSYARVWVNGEFVRDHLGGFTKWEGNITDLVSAGDSVILTVEVVDRVDDISYGSGYAKHQIGGILRDVELMALPDQHFEKLWFETHLDENYQDAELKVFYELSGNGQLKLKIEIFDDEDQMIKAVEKDIASSKGELDIPVSNPKKWDAEHPNLYRVAITLSENGKEILTINRKIGFREVHIEGNKLFVNGMQVKLRGADRHDIHPLLGRTTRPEYDLKDVLLAKEANMNFIRTSHYPPSETFLDYCDEYGIYVEDETAVCFVGSWRIKGYRATGATQDDPEYTGWYLSQLEEMVQNHRNHPSVIMWSIGNENTFGSNFVRSYEWVKENDHTRPVIYSYPGQVPDSLRIYEILSMHYPQWNGDLTQYGITTSGFSHEEMPALFDEWAHVACYNNFELKNDPNVRNFWGQSLDSMWTCLFESDGGLGGAIWCVLDETFMLPRDLEGFNQWWGIIDPNVIPATYMGPCVGYGEWGIVDTWRRKKPEFWNTKKAYSPTKIYIRQVNDFQPGKDLAIPVHNRFDHTNFNELKILWEYGNSSGNLENIDLEPHEKGEITIPGNDWKSGESINIRFYQNDTSLVDEYNIRFREREVRLPELAKGDLSIKENGNLLSVSGNDFEMKVNKITGLIESVVASGELIIQSGPYINLKLAGENNQTTTIKMQDYIANWKCKNFSYELNDGILFIHSTGVYDRVSADFMIKVDVSGLINITYQVYDVPENIYISEAGIKFITGKEFKTLEWDRESYFSSYPDEHSGRPAGRADISERPEMNYREKPQHNWGLDTKGFYYFGLDVELPYTNIVRSLKENIYSYSLITGENSGIQVLSDGSHACRFDEIDGENTLIINDTWDYPGLLWGNYMKLIPSEEVMEGKVNLKVN